MPGRQNREIFVKTTTILALEARDSYTLAPS
jgi:hypothetical protein